MERTTVGAPCSPLWAVQALSWVSSLGTGVATTGLYYMTKDSYGFSDRENYGLALAGGIAYIAGASGAGRILKLLGRWGLSTRGVLGGVITLLGLMCLLPMAMAPGEGERASHWPMWVLMIAYQPLTGILWPVIEGYLSGGRSGEGLRSALGRWNVTWSSALVVALCVMGLTRGWLGADRAAPLILASLSVVHLASLLLLRPLGAEPGEHLPEHHEPHPPVYTRLLTTFRVLLPMSYVVNTALTPYLPSALAKLGVTEAWRPVLGATWTAARVATFFSLERWHGWHGRWWPALGAVMLLLGGFGAAVLSPHLGAGPFGVGVMLAGLAAFGVGMASIYTASLYYAMECEREDVDAGSRHETLIGLGYTIGPACGLAGLIAAPTTAGGLTPDIVTLALVGVISLTVIAGGGWHAARERRAG